MESGSKDNAAYDITTGHLDKVLEGVRSDTETERYVKAYTEGNYGSFADYFNEYISRKDLKVPEVVSGSNVSSNYIYNILGKKRNPGRDKVLALCIGAGMSVREINRGLKLAGLGVLYAKNERDARITIAVNRGVKSVIELNIMLEEKGLDILE